MLSLSAALEHTGLLARLSTRDRLRRGVSQLLGQCGFEYFHFVQEHVRSLTEGQQWQLGVLPPPLSLGAMAPLAGGSEPGLWSWPEPPVPAPVRGVLQPWLALPLHGVVLNLPSGLGSLSRLTLAANQQQPLPPAWELGAFALYLGHTLAECAQRLQQQQPERPAPVFNAREQQCLAWAAEGHTNAEIGRLLGISERTTTYHIARACRKIGARNRQHAVTQALLTGALPLDCLRGQDQPARLGSETEVRPDRV
ncbi:helix-turn-helix transcriptional regulator [Isoalcanivorax beigongshangi]|uniref:LuxR C-terminal-related transcriptional regulator n=1 Tax=Isoalcanivorax beigongshangi TaxID=3238810 RepID=A0ABV4ADH9_9GAMM